MKAQELFTKLEAFCQEYGVITDHAYELLDMVAELVTEGK